MEKIKKQQIDMNGKTLLITGGAGFIGSHLIQRLLSSYKSITVINIDCMTDYNPIPLKEWRLSENQRVADETSAAGNKYIFIKGDIGNWR